MNNRGMVLVTVLWVVVVISFIALSLSAAVRVEMRAMENSFDSERAFFMAKSAAEVVFQDVLKPGLLNGSQVRQEEQVYVVPFDSGEARVQLESEGGRIDINGASDKLLLSLLASLGVENSQRKQIAESILDWRDTDDVPMQDGAETNDYGQVIEGKRRLPANAAFERLDELMLVKYMTPEIFFGRIEFDEILGTYRRTRGLRELITLGSDRAQVNVNEALADVLKGLPGMSADMVEKIVLERERKPFDNVQDLVGRVPELQYNESMDYLNTSAVPPTGLVSVATVMPSGASRTVRLDFRRERQKKILVVSPLIYKDIEIISFGGWRY
jgi:general secretion pathway protein K